MQHSHKKSALSAINVQNIHSVLEQVSQILVRLLQDLKYIYVANGINYVVEGYHNVLVRLLMPFQLLSYFGVVDHSQMIISNPSGQKLQPILNQHKNLKQEFKSHQNKSNQLKLIPLSLENKKQMPKKSSAAVRKSQNHINPGDIPSKANKRYYYRDRSRPLLNEDIQDQLSQWIMNKLQQNKRIRRKDIARKALQLNSNQNGFGGSIGWVRRFLERRPYIRAQLKKSLNIRKNMRLSQKINKDVRVLSSDGYSSSLDEEIYNLNERSQIQKTNLLDQSKLNQDSQKISNVQNSESQIDIRNHINKTSSNQDEVCLTDRNQQIKFQSQEGYQNQGQQVEDIQSQFYHAHSSQVDSVKNKEVDLQEHKIPSNRNINNLNIKNNLKEIKK